MNKKFLLLLPVLFVSVLANAQVTQDTVIVKDKNSQIPVDTVVVGSDNNLSVKGEVDTVIVKSSNKGLYIFENSTGDISVWTTNRKRSKENKFYSHLAGLNLGVNIYMNKDWKMNFPAEYSGMDLNVAKSTNVMINFGAISTKIIGNKFGFTAGIGTEWHNYRFDDDVTLVKDKQNHVVKVEPLPTDKNVIKSKLTDWWLNIPVAFEVNGGKYNSFYFSAGAIGSVLLNSHTKVVTKDGGKDKDKTWNQFYLNPFRVSLMAKAGYGNFGIYATYSLIQLFQDGKGPELYPFAAGITLNF